MHHDLARVQFNHRWDQEYKDDQLVYSEATLASAIAKFDPTQYDRHRTSGGRWHIAKYPFHRTLGFFFIIAELDFSLNSASFSSWTGVVRA